jgi:hypothetical protein
MKVLLDKFKVWAQGGEGRGGEEALKQQVEAAVEGYKHQLQVFFSNLDMKHLICNTRRRLCMTTCAPLKSRLCSSKQVTRDQWNFIRHSHPQRVLQKSLTSKTAAPCGSWSKSSPSHAPAAMNSRLEIFSVCSRSGFETSASGNFTPSAPSCIRRRMLRGNLRR